MNKELEIKKVPFMGTDLVAARDGDGQIWAGVRWMCNGIGLSKGQTQRQLTNIGTDEVLSEGVANLQLPTRGGPQETLCLKLDFVPLWLARIAITPAMKEENPELANTLKQYQLKAKDVLAAAFLPEAVTSVAPAAVTPTVMPPFGELARFLAQITRVMREPAGGNYRPNGQEHLCPGRCSLATELREAAVLPASCFCRGNLGRLSAATEITRARKEAPYAPHKTGPRAAQPLCGLKVG